MAQTLAQWEREILIGALLDVKFSRWTQWVLDMGEEAVDNLPDGRTPLLGNIIDSIGARLIGGETAPPEEKMRCTAQYLRAVALMSDDTLTWFVEELTENPLKVGRSAS